MLQGKRRDDISSFPISDMFPLVSCKSVLNAKILLDTFTRTAREQKALFKPGYWRDETEGRRIKLLRARFAEDEETELQKMGLSVKMPIEECDAFRRLPGANFVTPVLSFAQQWAGLTVQARSPDVQIGAARNAVPPEFQSLGGSLQRRFDYNHESIVG